MVAPVGPGGNTGWNAGGHRRVEPVSNADHGRQHRQGSPESQGRALVPIASHAGSEPARYHYYGANAAFLTHLIATDAGVPQTRARRRAEPAASAQAYTTAAGSTFYLKPGSILNRSA
ncbi:hypothetical protein C8N35_1011373 [Breoghania corrubedonensis]|uniref:Uncharacterized protein n=1 Tax=Breoghania corrubedonensis TaxID=665038 RepID=A0A2T5VHT5_9HYPH|nr:hypothetical protein [Breoghania corrubedonensis]PTW63322.1 hypothetical protein C8N35_1011373 [Breoghania corrubedonensis]